MAVAFTQLTTGSDQVDRSTYTTASVTLTAGRLYILVYGGQKASSVAAPTSIATTGGAVTFTNHSTSNWSSSTQNGGFFRALPTSTVTDTIAISVSAWIGAWWSLIEVTGTKTSGTNGADAFVQSSGTSSTSGTTLNKSLVSPASVTAGNARFSTIQTNTNATATITSGATPDGTWTSGTSVTNGPSPNGGIRSAWNATPATGDIKATWTYTSGGALIFIAELAVDSGDFVGAIPI